jgi:putative CocE/NonD family hydrolase
MPTIQKHLFIHVRDGIRLAATVHWPDGADRYPAIVEYHPYRKDDRSAPRAADHDYFARNGFVSLRLDVRGTGSSEGVNTDEYMPAETRDGFDAIEWIAAQPWSNGKVGMFGSSYGGFTCLQVATLRPPHLAAIAPIYATDDRYTDDCHYKGGAFEAYYDVGTYGTMMIALNALPP